MAEDDPQDAPEQEPTPTQKTKPAKGKPVEIPVPKRSAWERVLKRATEAASRDD